MVTSRSGQDRYPDTPSSLFSSCSASWYTLPTLRVRCALRETTTTIATTSLYVALPPSLGYRDSAMRTEHTHTHTHINTRARARVKVQSPQLCSWGYRKTYLNKRCYFVSIFTFIKPCDNCIIYKNFISFEIQRQLQESWSVKLESYNIERWNLETREFTFTSNTMQVLHSHFVRAFHTCRAMKNNWHVFFYIDGYGILRAGIAPHTLGVNFAMVQQSVEWFVNENALRGLLVNPNLKLKWNDRF